jgi:Flp pilus assembly protein TadB
LAWASCLLAGVALAGWAGLLVGALIGGLVAALVTRLSGRVDVMTRSIDPADVPMVLDLLAAALRSGAPAPAALICVAEGAPEPIRIPLRRTAALLRLGATPAESVAHLHTDPALAALGAVVARSADSGVRWADGLRRRAASLREELRLAELARAQRIGVFALLPLGLCFLPAFICVGIVPIITGVASQVFS